MLTGHRLSANHPKPATTKSHHYGRRIGKFSGRIGLKAHLILPHANLLESVVQEPSLGMVHTIGTRGVVEGVNVADGLVNLDRGLGLLLV